jgi:hypothetical protein
MALSLSAYICRIDRPPDRCFKAIKLAGRAGRSPCGPATGHENPYARDAHVNGSGLGLALAAWMATHHRTQIEVESDFGAGSSFSWKLPLVSSISVPAETAPAQAELSPLVGIRS